MDGPPANTSVARKVPRMREHKQSFQALKALRPSADRRGGAGVLQTLVAINDLFAAADSANAHEQFLA